MRERLGIDPALRLLLDAVVADCGGGVERLLDLLRVVEQPAVADAVRPHAGEAVGLQLEARPSTGWRVDGSACCACCICSLMPTRFWMWCPYSWATMYCVGQVAGGTERVLELGEEVEVEVHLASTGQ